MQLSILVLGFILPAFEASIIPSVERNETLVSQQQGNFTIPQDNQTAWQVNQTTLPAPLSFKSENTEIPSSNLMKANLSSLDPTISSLFRKSGQNHDSARTVDSKNFYTWRVVCPTSMQMRFGMNQDSAAYPKIGGRRRPDPRDHWEKSTFRYAPRACEGCLCSDEGDILVRLWPVQYGPKGRKKFSCRIPEFVLKCTAWFGCRCEVTMHQPEVDPESTFQEHQDALDNIPFFVKAQNPGWRWNPVDRFSMSWSKMGSASNDGSPNYRATYGKQLHTGMKEPYDLEGPDEFDPQEKEMDLEWLRTPFWRSEGSYNSGSELAWKRSKIEGVDKGIKQGPQAQGDFELENSPKGDTERAVAN
ncbi:hypothetical protein EYR41_001950 [Orbilia oligospora]|uniref:Uncharacterized protein n=1 Tax=Orbilia oligospora TaxID=2813651 RepID=A0A8H2ED23_ORBOL|nr:hypothetical protein EYR41_001950 [Orbilia oligospora]